MATEHKVGNGAAAAMLTVAVLIDGIQALLTFTVIGSIVATLITFLASFGFWLWFALHGVKYTGKDAGKKALIVLASVIAELVPFVNMLPATTAGILGIILTERVKEAKEAGTSPDARKLAAMARLARMKAARSQALETARIQREAQRISQGTPPDA